MVPHRQISGLRWSSTEKWWDVTCMVGSTGLNPVAMVQFWCLFFFGNRWEGERKEEREGRKEGRGRKNKRNKVRKKERKETREVEEAHWSHCLPAFLPASVADNYEPSWRKGTRGEGERCREHTFKAGTGLLLLCVLPSVPLLSWVLHSMLRKSSSIKSCLWLHQN